MPHLHPLTVCAALLFAALAAPPTRAADEKPDTLAGTKLGSPVCGPKITELSQLAGKLVVVEFWGITCPPCLESIPGLCALADGHADDVVVIASQDWEADAGSVKKTWERHAGGKGKGISVVNHGSVPGVGTAAVPHACIIDASGNLVWQGHPVRLERALKPLLARIADDKEAKLQAKVQAGQGIAKLLGAKAPPELKTWIEAIAAAKDDKQKLAKADADRLAVAKAIQRCGADEAARQQAIAAVLAPEAAASWSTDSTGSTLIVDIGWPPVGIGGLQCTARLIVPDTLVLPEKPFSSSVHLSTTKPNRTLIRTMTSSGLSKQTTLQVELTYTGQGLTFRQTLDAAKTEAKR